MKLKTFSNDCPPTKLPVLSTLAAWLILHLTHAPRWMWAIVGVVCLFRMIVAVVLILLADLFPDLSKNDDL